MSVHIEGDGCWPDLDLEGKDIDAGIVTSVACLPQGMAGGTPSVSVLLTLPDGRRVLAQTSLALLLIACDAFVARHGDPRTAAAEAHDAKH
jgi:hypothetical protein